MNDSNSNWMAQLPPVIERHELKYMIPISLVEPICQYLEGSCALDTHSLDQPNNFYPVNSLYFDTPNYRFLKQRRWGAQQRFNMRMRAYGDGETGPYFAEVKYKSATSVKKFRAAVAASEWPDFLRYGADATVAPQIDDKERISRQLFLHLAESYAIEPKIFTCYRRRAFYSLIDDYARVTFDINMRYRQQDPLFSRDPWSLSPLSGCVNYDSQTVYGDEMHFRENVILELKASIGAVPVWMIELIQRFQLKQVGFSKYLNSSLTEHDENGLHYMAAERSAGAFLI